MCTVTWIVGPKCFELFDNRDESVLRAHAEAPRLHTAEGVRFVAPVDGDFGGTWVAANAHGTVLCLLNRYGGAGDAIPAGAISRGLLVKDLAAAASPAEAGERLADLELAHFRAFTLVVGAPGAEPALWGWDGSRLVGTTARMPLVSSPAAEVVLARRRETLDELLAGGPATPELLLAYHRSHRPERGPASVCMHHPRAGTVSFTRVRVDEAHVRMDYSDGPPCTDPPVTRVELEREGTAS